MPELFDKFTQEMSIYIDIYLFQCYNPNMVMQRNYPDYNRISEIENELQEICRRLERARYFDEEASDKEDDLEEELKQLIMGERVEVEGKSCREKHCRGNKRDSAIYYPGKVHHLDGDTNNESFGNLAMVCPKCQAHILLSRYSPQDIWLLKAGGLSNAEVGRLLSISRERVRQLCKKYEANLKANQEAELARLEADLDGLVKQMQRFDDSLKSEYIKDEDGFLIKGRRKKGKRLIDRRTLKKRIIVELNKLKAKGVNNNERPHNQAVQE